MEHGAFIFLFFDNGAWCVLQIAADIKSMATTTPSSGEETQDHQHGENESSRVTLVSFGGVEVQSYEIILGDNPGVSGGPPLTIDWEPFELASCSVNEYEEEKAKRPARDILRMKMTTAQRINLLARTNAVQEIMIRTKQVMNTRRQRAETQTILYRQGSEEKVERIMRVFKNIFTNKKRKERAYRASTIQEP